jgi:hypothetical protein
MPEIPPAVALSARLPPTPKTLLSLRFATRFERPLLMGLSAADGECILAPVDWHPGNASTAPPLALDSPFGQPDWDATHSSVGLAAVWSRPGSAISPLWTQAGREAATLFTGQ